MFYYQIIPIQHNYPWQGKTDLGVHSLGIQFYQHKNQQTTPSVQINALDCVEFLSLSCFPLRLLSNSIFERGKIVAVTKIGSISISRLYSTVGGNFSASKVLVSS